MGEVAIHYAEGLGQSNMNFPIALEAYVEIAESDKPDPALRLAREVVHNEIEAAQFQKTWSEHKIVTSQQRLMI